MSLLVLGVLLWAGTHLFPAVAVDVRSRLIERFVSGPYRGGFALLIVISVVLIILGWKAATPMLVYRSPSLGPPLTGMAMAVALILFFSARLNGTIKRFVRHPQLTGVTIWAFAHLVMNGDNRSVVLFGVMLVWAVVSIILINRRDGEWQKPEVPGWSREFRGLAISLVVFVAFVFLHRWIAGVPII